MAWEAGRISLVSQQLGQAWADGTTLIQVPHRNGKLSIFEVAVDCAATLVAAVRNGATLEDIVESGAWVYSVDFSVVD